MNNGPLSKQSVDFAIKIVNYYKWLVSEKKEYVLSKQILRSGTSIGANIHEADFAVSKADFILKNAYGSERSFRNRILAYCA